MLSRVEMCTQITDIIVATTDNSHDDPIEDMCSRMNIKVFRGSEENVLDRVYKATKSMNADIIVELTGDCPLIDPNLIDQTVSTFLINPNVIIYIIESTRVTQMEWISKFLQAKHSKGLGVWHQHLRN